MTQPFQRPGNSENTVLLLLMPIFFAIGGSLVMGWALELSTQKMISCGILLAIIISFSTAVTSFFFRRAASNALRQMEGKLKVSLREVIDPQGKLIYAGAIDDRPTPDPKDVHGADNYVSDALNEAMLGKAVTTPYTRPYGCSVKYPD